MVGEVKGEEEDIIEKSRNTKSKTHVNAPKTPKRERKRERLKL
jgi:hypothetical protein